MPSPLAHTVTGAAFAYLHPSVPRNPISHNLYKQIMAVLVLANLPDFDFLPQLITGVRYHHTFTHSLVFALLFCLAATAAVVALGWGTFFPTFSLCLVVYGSHVALDMFGGGQGVALWWPFSLQPVRATAQVFPPVNYSEGLIDRTHLHFLIFEAVYASLLIVLTMAGKWLASGRSQGSRNDRSASKI